MTGDMLDIVEALRRLAESGSRSDRRLAALVLEDMRFASRAAIADLAGRGKVSEPTVTRFCRALGCDGFREFKFHLAQALAIGGPYLEGERAAAPAPSPDFDGVAARAIAAIDALRGSFEPAVVERIAAEVAAAGQVLAFGSGGSSSIAALELQHRLFRLGLPVTAYSDGEMQRMTASVATPRTVVLVFSISGYVQAEIDAARIARSYGAFVAAVTAPGSQLAAVVDAVVPFSVAEDGDLYKPSASRYALLVLVDLIAVVTARLRGPQVLEGLRRIKQSLNTLKVNNPDLPIGD